MSEKIDIEAFKKEWFSFEEIESIKRWLDDVENGKTKEHKDVKIEARKLLFSKQKTIL